MHRSVGRALARPLASGANNALALGPSTAQPPNPNWMGWGGWSGRGADKGKSLARIRGQQGGERWKLVLWPQRPSHGSTSTSTHQLSTCSPVSVFLSGNLYILIPSSFHSTTPTPKWQPSICSLYLRICSVFIQFVDSIYK